MNSERKSVDNKETERKEILMMNIMYTISDLEVLLQEAGLCDLEKIISEVKKILLNRYK